MKKPGMLIVIVPLACLLSCSRQNDQAPKPPSPDAAQAEGKAQEPVAPQLPPNGLAALRASLEDRIHVSDLPLRREHGVQLRGSYDIHRTKNDIEIRIHWELDYLGPRAPLIIHRPSLEPASGCQTMVEFFPVAVKINDCPITFSRPVVEGRLRSQRKSFLKLQLGEVARGTITVKASDFWQELRKRWPKHLGQEPKLLFAVLTHMPRDRGEHLDLDAWTGDLHTRRMEIGLEDLKPLRLPDGAAPPRP